MHPGSAQLHQGRVLKKKLPRGMEVDALAWQDYSGILHNTNCKTLDMLETFSPVSTLECSIPFTTAIKVIWFSILATSHDHIFSFVTCCGFCEKIMVKPFIIQRKVSPNEETVYENLIR